jgi:hypothetical protein
MAARLRQGAPEASGQEHLTQMQFARLHDLAADAILCNRNAVLWTELDVDRKVLRASEMSRLTRTRILKSRF